MKKQSTLFAFKFRGKWEKDKADSDSTVPAKSTDKADSGARYIFPYTAVQTPLPQVQSECQFSHMYLSYHTGEAL